MRGQLILENGMRFTGKVFGHFKETIGEVVFNTGMTGYQEILTDPSYYGQMVTMTYPLIGNYGVNIDDHQSQAIQVKGLIVRERAEEPCNFRCEFDLDTYLKKHRVMGIEGIDTRALTKVIRNEGTLKGIITCRELDESQVAHHFATYHNKHAVKKVTRKEITRIKSGVSKGREIAVLDFGVKEHILSSFLDLGYDLCIYPAFTKAETILADKPVALFLSNGPGDPKDIQEVLPEIQKVIKEELPLMGICLGHQLIALALGGDTEKMKFGHRGANHPVKDIETGRVYMTSQNHGYVVKELPEGLKVTHTHVNDGTVEGFSHIQLPIKSVQFHPEASPGPYDASVIFSEFIDML